MLEHEISKIKVLVGTNLRENKLTCLEVDVPQ